jgi:hypothetical protein
VPRLDAEFGAQPVAQRPEPGRLHRLQVLRRPDLLDLAALEAVDAGAECGAAVERVDRRVPRDVDHAVGGRYGGRAGLERLEDDDRGRPGRDDRGEEQNSRSPPPALLV